QHGANHEPCELVTPGANAPREKRDDLFHDADPLVGRMNPRLDTRTSGARALSIGPDSRLMRHDMHVAVDRTNRAIQGSPKTFGRRGYRLGGKRLSMPPDWY